MNGSSPLGATALFLMACSLKATFLLGGAWLVASATRSLSAAFRHSLWVAAVLGTLALPLLALLIPAWHSTALRSAGAVWTIGHAAAVNGDAGKMPVTMVEAVLTAPAASRWAEFVLLVWGIGFCVFAARLAAGLIGLRRIASTARALYDSESARMAQEICLRMGIRRDLRILESDQPLTMPVTWGALRPTILLPVSATNWLIDCKQNVLLHEIAHVARMDWVFQILAEFVKAAYWFHPLAWIAAARLRRESEQASDDCVLGAGIDASGYARNLLALARTLGNPNRKWSAALATAYPTNLERRFRAMLDPSIDRRNLTRRRRAVVATAALLLLIPLAALRLPAQDAAGKFGGTISDPSGMPIQNATVILNNHKANRIQMTTSDAQGRYSFVGLPAGQYELRAMKPGFSEFRATIAALDSGHEVTQDLTLQVGGVDEEMDVIADGGPRDGVKGGVENGVKDGVSGEVIGGVASDGPPKTIRVRIGGEVQAPKLIEKVQPAYPAKAKAAGIEGTVILHAIIGREGNPLSLRVMNRQIDPELARAAVEAVSQWRYRSTLLNGDLIEVDTTIMVNFTLKP